MSTAARVLTLNCRNENAMELFPRRRWSRRRPYLVVFIKNCAPSVIGVQECTNNMAAEITQGLGPNWTFWGSGTAKIIWDSIKWVALDQFQAGLPYTVLGVTKQRPITMLKVQSIKTGEFTWFVDTHLAVNIPNEEAIRQQQMKRATALIEQRPDHERVVFFGDFNSVPTDSSVRKIASNAGYKHLRAKLAPNLITRRTCNTFNGWKITKRESKWIDDVLTSPTVEPYAAAIMLTDSTRFPVHASDHNGVFAKVQFSAATTGSPL
jgi:endonuclease/exonuclease/phosphatase family metal-dependent hydrolase